MIFWNNIVNAALLGTDKKQISGAELCPALAGYADTPGGQEADNEDKFLHVAALAYNYRRCGFTAIKKEGLPDSVAEEETQAYCSPAATASLDEVLATDGEGMLRLWLEACAAKNVIVPPDYIPALLNRAMKTRRLQQLAMQCCGRRGAWLSTINKNWAITENTATNDELWQTGAIDQRRAALRAMRQNDPAHGREQLVACWQAENANTRADLLKQMEVNINAEDLEWLESLLKDKSQKVKDEALRLCKLIPGSTVMQQYIQIVKAAMQLKKEKSMLGLKTKIVIEVQPPVVDEPVFKTGIEKLSKDKNISDDNHILMQLAGEIPPAMWEEHFGVAPEQIIEYFEKDKATTIFIEPILEAALKFKDSRWVLAIVTQTKHFDVAALPLLPEKDREECIIAHFSYSEGARSYVTIMTKEWSMPLANTIMAYIASEPYEFSNNYFKNNFHLLPVGLPELSTFGHHAEKGGYSYKKYAWEGYHEAITKLIIAKKNVIAAFK